MGQMTCSDACTAKASANLLGLLTANAIRAAGDRAVSEARRSTPTEIRSTISRLNASAARARKKLGRVRPIRDHLAALGVAIKDNKDGTTTWELKR